MKTHEISNILLEKFMILTRHTMEHLPYFQIGELTYTLFPYFLTKTHNKLNIVIQFGVKDIHIFYINTNNFESMTRISYFLKKENIINEFFLEIDKLILEEI